MEKISATFTFSPRILEALGISAYNSVRKCLAELVSNCYDADATEVKVTLPDVLDDNALISVSDNGCGMTAADLAERFLHIGRNRRQDGQRTESGRLVIGSKGLGKLAGFGIAERIRVTSRRDGVQSVITIDQDDLAKIEQLSNYKFDIVRSETSRPDGTTIELLRLHSGLQLPAADVVRRHLHRTMPELPEFIIVVNSVECSAEEVHGERHNFSQKVPQVGEVSGFYIIANARQNNPGLAVRVRGRIVQGPSLFGLDTRAHGFFTSERIVGEFRAEFLDPEAPSDGHSDLIKTSRDGFVEDADVVQLFSDWAGNFVRDIIKGVDKSETKKRADALLESPEIKARLDALPAHIRGTASIVVRGIVSKLKTASDDDAKNLLEWVLRYYESNVLKELMQAIAAADIKEAEKLATLVSQWGLTQLNSITEIVETQVSIIGRLEELVASDKAYEIDLHKLIESNLWLVSEGLELWSSDKPLKKLLDGKLDEAYEEKQDLRPDLICRSQGERAVILEFKRPKEKVKMGHLTQALEYEGVIASHRPGLKISTYVVGRQYDPAVLAVRHKQSQAGLYLWSFEEILQKARARFEQILEILGK